jgi:hypothetical protein
MIREDGTGMEILRDLDVQKYLIIKEKQANTITQHETLEGGRTIVLNVVTDHPATYAVHKRTEPLCFSSPIRVYRQVMSYSVCD